MHAHHTDAPIRFWLNVATGKRVLKPTARQIDALEVVPCRDDEHELGVNFRDPDAETADPVFYWRKGMSAENLHYYDRRELQAWVATARAHGGPITDPLTRAPYDSFRAHRNPHHNDRERFRGVATLREKDMSPADKLAIVREHVESHRHDRLRYWVNYATAWGPIAAAIKRQLVALRYAADEPAATRLFRESVYIPTYSEEGVEMNFIHPDLFEVLLGDSFLLAVGTAVPFLLLTSKNRIHPTIWGNLYMQALREIEFKDQCLIEHASNVFSRALSYIWHGDALAARGRFCFETQFEDTDRQRLQTEWEMQRLVAAPARDLEAWALICVRKSGGKRQRA